MSCHVCLRGHDAHKLPFLCPVDARNQIYPSRLQNLQLLVENEALSRQISSSSGSSGGSTVAAAAATQTLLARDTTAAIARSSNRLREEINEARAEIRQRREALSARRARLAAASKGVAERRLRLQRDVEKSAQVFAFRWSQSAEDLAATRAFLCREVFKLYGLRRVRKSRGTGIGTGTGTGSGRYEYQLGRLPIPHLSDLESQSPEVISTQLAHVSHILMLIAHYLAIRLPAEITLPHRDYPRPTIFNLAASYRHNKNGSSSSSSSSYTPGASTLILDAASKVADSSYSPRPRPLYIDKPLRQLAKEDNAVFLFFIEGVTLLAYNIAWLCCSQGASPMSADKASSFDDICNMGRNLYSLLTSSCLYDGPLLPSAAPAPNNNNNNNYNNNSHDRNYRKQQPPPSTNKGDDGDGDGDDDDDAAPSSSWMGRFSHGSTFYALGGPDGAELIRSFRLAGPMKLADKLKKKLLGETPVPDWEILDDADWKLEDAPKAEKASHATTQVAAHDEKPPVPNAESKGWMKVKSR